MSFNYVKTQQNKNIVPATKVLPGMAKNDGGGASYVIDNWTFFDRFLIIGADTGTYYVTQDKNQTRNSDNAVKCIQQNGKRAVERIVEVSDKGLALRNDSAIYALALCFTHGNNETKLHAEQALEKVCRTGTHILMFTAFIKSMRGFGKVVSRAINNWYTNKDEKSLAFQLSKYQQREGWSHKDVFRLSHPKFGKRGGKYQISKWIMKGEVPTGKTEGQELIKLINDCRGMTPNEIIPHIKSGNLQREHIDSQLLNDTDVQAAMLENLGGTALVRNLGNMSKSGLLTGLNQHVKFVVNKLTSKEFIKKSRLHPLQLLVAQKTYAMGRGLKGDSTWSVNPTIVGALEDAFYLSFDNVERSNENYFFGLDVSGSMSSSCQGTPISCRDVTAVMALTFMKTQPWVFVGGFESKFTPLNMNKNQNLSQAIQSVDNLHFGSTNPGSAIEYAIKNKMDVDKFIFITDNDVNSGSNPSGMLREYRRVMKKPKTKMIVIGLTASNFSIADPKDPLMLDCSGFTPDFTNLVINF
jgi:60 kDa SS-A/Ro ribonucleoprotein